MKITDKDIDKLTKLSKLELSAGEKKSLIKDLKAILDFVEELREADFSQAKIELAAMPSNLREDKIERCLPSTIDIILKNAPEISGGLFKVKSVFGGEDLGL